MSNITRILATTLLAAAICAGLSFAVFVLSALIGFLSQVASFDYAARTNALLRSGCFRCYPQIFI